MQRTKLIDVAQGKAPADIVVRGAQWLDVFSGDFKQGDVAIAEGFVAGIIEDYDGVEVVEAQGMYLVPGFIDAHVHIESSMLEPHLYTQSVLPRGTTAVIWDPHEIANVKGVAGIEWALRASEGCLLDIFVMIPSCVPSTPPAMGLETSGACLTAADIEHFRDHPRVIGLAEMMNYPGVLNKDEDVLAKLDLYRHKNLDGHCPALHGKQLNAYAAAGIKTCHESVTRAEAQEKMTKGVHVLIREGSCAKNAEELLPLLSDFTSAVVGICSDDRNPFDVYEEGHLDAIINKALRQGVSPAQVFRAASFSAARLYGLPERGAIAPGYRADFCLVKPNNKRWQDGFAIARVFKNGRDIANHKYETASVPTNFSGRNINLASISKNKLRVPANKAQHTVRVIGVQAEQIVTDHLTAGLKAVAGELVADVANDVLKIAVIERYSGKGGHTVGFVRGFGLKRGALAASVAHDAHNIIVVGCDDDSMVAAVNTIIEHDGGIVVNDGRGQLEIIALPIGGLMRSSPPAQVAQRIGQLKQLAHASGCVLNEPFLQLSFLALPVIPTLKITDRGLVDVEKFSTVPLFC